MSIKIASMNFGDCDTILHNTPNGMKNIAEVLGPNGEVYWSSIKELTGIPPLSIRSNGTMLLDYLISGNMSQSGRPTPTTPIQPQETGERTGNLWDFGQWLTDRGATYTKDGDSYTFGSQQAMHSTPFYFSQTDIIISISGLIEAVTAANPRVHLLKADGTRAKTDALTTANSKYENVSCAGLIFDWSTPGNIKVSLPMLNTGSTALPYEPYGYKIPISSANTTTPVYLGEVQSTRKIKKLVLTGQENWTKNDVSSPSNYLYYQTGYLANKTCVCSHLADMGTLSATKVGTFNGNNVLYLNFGSAIMNAQPSGNTVEGLKEYLAAQYSAGTPVTVWYVLATPQTAVVNEPLRKIGDYADTLSMEQAGVQIPTNRGNTVIDVDTTLKPSQMYIKYK